MYPLAFFKQVVLNVLTEVIARESYRRVSCESITTRGNPLSLNQAELWYRSDTVLHSLDIFCLTRTCITLNSCQVFKPATIK